MNGVSRGNSGGAGREATTTTAEGNDTPSNNAEKDRSRVEPRSYIVRVSMPFVLFTLFSTTLLAFGVGLVARIFLVKNVWSRHSMSYRFPDGTFDSNKNKKLPYPEVQEGKVVPRTSYSSRNFGTAASATSSSVLVRRSSQDDGENGPSEETCLEGDNECLMDEEDHFPAGQHLLIDMKGVDSAFLDSEERLAQGIVETVKETRLTLLSYHCHTLVPMGVSCVGVLLESHISLHTWPQEGVITLDLFTCGSKPLVPVVPVIERIFGVPATNSERIEPPTVLWSHKLRGFRDDTGDPLQSFDLGKCILGMMDLDMKQEVVSFQTEYQRIDVYDVIRSSTGSLADHKRSLSNDGSYQSQHKDLFAPNRIVMLDGIMQSNLYGDAAYHEALVHPAMFAHSNPERVAIIGGGEGATLREVLKHKTVQKAIMVEIDREMVEVSHQHLQPWSDCSILVGSAEWCVEDTRTVVYYEDALMWFINRFDSTSDVETKKIDNAEPLDIVIVDALDPEDEVEFADVLYNSNTFLEAIYAGLDTDGILVMQLGASPTTMDPPELFTKYRTRAILMQQLQGIGFESLQVYEESHAGFGAPWSFVVAFKKYESRMNWYASEAEIEMAIRERSMPTNSGDTPFEYFDGATMVSYRIPHRNFEKVFCRRDPVPAQCHELRGLITERDNENTGVHVHGKTGVHCYPMTFDLITRLVDKKDTNAELDAVQSYIHDYGTTSLQRGGPQVLVENHSRKGNTSNIVNTNPNSSVQEIYNPVMDRHMQASELVFAQKMADVGNTSTNSRGSG